MVQLESKIQKHRNTEFFRATVIGFLDTHTMNPKAVVKLIDLGYIDSVSVHNFYATINFNCFQTVFNNVSRNGECIVYPTNGKIYQQTPLT